MAPGSSGPLGFLGPPHQTGQTTPLTSSQTLTPWIVENTANKGGPSYTGQPAGHVGLSFPEARPSNTFLPKKALKFGATSRPLRLVSQGMKRWMGVVRYARPEDGSQYRPPAFGLHHARPEYRTYLSGRPDGEDVA